LDSEVDYLVYGTITKLAKAGQGINAGVRWPYDSSEPFIEEIQGTCADPKAVLKSPRTVNFAHGLSRIMTAALDAGFAIRKFEEF
jgi:hypothetical protein